MMRRRGFVPRHTRRHLAGDHARPPLNVVRLVAGAIVAMVGAALGIMP
jgi:hypothetical protein